MTLPAPRVTDVGLNEMAGIEAGGRFIRGRLPPPKPPPDCTDSWVTVPVRATFPENPPRPVRVRVEFTAEFTVPLRISVFGDREKSRIVKAMVPVCAMPLLVSVPVMVTL